ncbi:hypothetical protein QFC21_002444 [Naganishia friedmannii]|uniref:Uncharacterized protein n=1 Tax=Naganishia friedmannii TaxID=89922 RepID=A0ACC2VYV9_9TREE|nr:hypothetical protein QFC21_002444 [Naganishia friedmannii]
MRGDSYNPPAGNDGYMSRDIYDIAGNEDMSVDRRPDAGGPPAAGYNDFRKRRRTPSPPGGARGAGRYDPRPRYFVQSGPAPGTGNGYAGGPPPPFDDRGGPYRGGWDGPAGRGDFRDREYDRGRERDHAGGYDRGYNPGYGPRRSVSPRRGPDSHWPSAGDARYPYPRDDNNRQGPGDVQRGGPEAAGPGLLDPEQSENSVSIGFFGEWYKAAHPEQLTAKDPTTGEPINIKAVIETKYDEYRKSFLVRQAKKYGVDEAMQQLRTHATRQGRVPAVQRYLEELEKGTWDEVNYDASPVPTEVRKMKDGRDANGIGKVISPSDLKLVELPPPRNQIFIKTIPPNIGRHALEAFLPSQPGFDYLAMTEPFLKKGCHRAGYIQFKENVDIDHVVAAIDRTEVKDFTLHMNVNTVNFTGRIRESPALSGSLARMKHDAAQAKAMALALENELSVSEEERKAAEAEKKSLDDVAKTTYRLLTRGSEAVQARIQRLIQEAEDADNAASAEEVSVVVDLEREKVRIELDQWVSYLRNGLNSCYYCVVPMDFPEELYHRCMRHVRITGNGEPSEEAAEDQDDENELEPEVRPAVTTDVDGQPLDIKMRPRPRVVEPNAKWSARLDSKIKLIVLPRSELNMKEYYGKNRDDEIDKIARPLIKEEEANKYRCKNCSKLFKAAEFVHKHLTTKHAELFEHLNRDLPLFDNFILDPKHVVPLQDQPASVNDKPVSRPLHPPYDPSTATATGRFSARFMDRGGRGRGRGYAGRPGDSPGHRGNFGNFNSPRGGYRGSRDGPPMGAPMNLTPGREDPRAKRGRVSYKDLDAAPAAVSRGTADTGGGGLDY